MKPTFRQFIEDIEVDDSAYSPEDSDSTIDTIQRSIHRDYKPDSGAWKELPADFGHEGFKVLYKKQNSLEYDVALVDTRDLSKYTVPFGFVLPKDPNRVAVNVNLAKWSIALRNSEGRLQKLHGMKTDVLSGAKSYRGAGLAPMLYRMLVQHGQVLFSSTTQTSGGQSTWRRLVKSIGDIADVGVIVHQYDEAARYAYQNWKQNQDVLRRLGINPEGKFTEDDIADALGNDDDHLLMGSLSTLDDIAYDDSSSYWVIAPHGTLGEFKKFAIKVK